jgi:capsular polysaccharide transport system permease protein
MSAEAAGGRGGWSGSAPPDLAKAWRAAVVQWRVFSAVFIREAGMRRGQAYGLGWLVGALEPLMMIAALAALFSVTNHQPAYGPNMLLFLGTGVFPLYVFLYTSIRVRQPATLITSGRFPLEMPLDEILVHALLHMISTLIVAIAFFAGLAFAGIHDAVPHDIPALFGSTLALYLFGVGVGIFNAAVSRIFPFWSILWSGTVRLIYHFSGLYYVIDFFSPRARQFFAANPITHGLNWFRHAFYPFYPDTSSDGGNVMIWALISILLGLCLERAFRREYMRGERFN